MLKIPSNNTIETPKSFNWIEGGVLYSIAKDKVYIDLEEANNITQAFKKLSSHPLPLLVDLHTTSGQSSEARNYFATDPTHLTTFVAVALLVSNPVARILANFFLGLNKPLKPTRLFTSNPEAIQWLSQFAIHSD